MIALRLDEDLQEFDIVAGEAGLALDEGLATSVAISLFTDRTDRDADRDEPRGWWADAFDSLPIGSRLWTLDRAKTTNGTLRLAEQFAREALGWLIEDGVASEVTVTAERVASFVMLLKVTVERPATSAWSGAWRVHLDAV